MPGAVDWHFLATDITNENGENSDAGNAIQKEIEGVTNWPDVNFFDRFQ